jgi:hypothetical protein
MPAIGEEQLRAVSENKGGDLPVQRGINRQINRNSVRRSRGRSAIAGTVKGVWRRQFRRRGDYPYDRAQSWPRGA